MYARGTPEMDTTTSFEGTPSPWHVHPVSTVRPPLIGLTQGGPFGLATTGARRQIGGLFQLFRAGAVDGRAVLRADIVALAHALGRVVQFPEHGQQFTVAHFALVEDHQHNFGVPGQA